MTSTPTFSLGFNDGPESIDEALRLLTSLVENGVITVAATSHVSEMYPSSPPRLAEAFQALGLAARTAELPIALVLGAEVSMLSALRLGEAELAQLCFSGTRWLLLETPHTDYPTGLASLVRHLRLRHFRVLLAHPERNPHVQRQPSLASEIASAGALIQITGASVTGRFGRRAQDAAWHLLDTGLAHVVASDAHNETSRAADGQDAYAALRNRLGRDRAAGLMRHAPEAVLADSDWDEVLAVVGSARTNRHHWRFRRNRE